MQDNSELNLKQSVFPKNIFLGIKIIFVIMLSYVLYQTFTKKEQNLPIIFNEFFRVFKTKNIVNFSFVSLLIVANWACEAKKWQILANSFNPLSFKVAFQSVLVGLSFGFITPANMGDFGGRLIHLENKNRRQAIGANLLGNGIQFYITLLFGILAYILFFRTNFPIFHQIIFGILIFSAVLGLIIYLKRFSIHKLLDKVNWISTYKIYWISIVNFNNITFLRVFLWSIVRFFIISLQFVFVLLIFEININLIQLWSISCLVLLFKTIIPQINFFTDLGIRQLSALHFFGLLSVNLSPVVSAIFFIWIINILLPVMIGGILFINLKTN